MARTQYDVMSSVLLSSYVQYLLLSNNIVKSGTFTPATTVADVKRKVMYQTKTLITKVASDPARAAEVTATSARGTAVRVSFISDINANDRTVRYNNTSPNSMFAYLFKGFMQEKVNTYFSESEKPYFNFNCDLNSLSMDFLDPLYQSDAKLFEASEVEIVPLSTKAQLIYKLITKSSDILNDAIDFRRHMKTAIVGGVINPDKRWSVREMGYITRDLAGLFGYYDANSTRVRLIRQCCMMIRDLLGNPAYDPDAAIYMAGTAALDLISFDGNERVTRSLEDLSSWLTAQCTAISSATFSIETMAPTERPVEEVAPTAPARPLPRRTATFAQMVEAETRARTAADERLVVGLDVPTVMADAVTGAQLEPAFPTLDQLANILGVVDGPTLGTMMTATGEAFRTTIDTNIDRMIEEL